MRAHINAERLRHAAVLGGGAQDAAVIRTLQECAESGRDRDRCQDHQQIVDRHAEVAGTDGSIDKIGVVQRAWIGSPNELEDVLKHQDQRKRQQQLEALVTGIYRPQGPARSRADEPRNTPDTISPGRISQGDIPN